VVAERHDPTAISRFYLEGIGEARKIMGILRRKGACRTTTPCRAPWETGSHFPFRLAAPE